MNQPSNLAPAISDPLRRKLPAAGEAGRRWLAALPGLVQDLAREWELAVGAGLSGGSEAYVVAATTRDGAKVVLKIAMPPLEGNTVLEREITALSLAGGQGYVRLLRYDPARRALLLERLGRPLKRLGLAPARQLEIICQTLQPTWRPVPAPAARPAGLPAGDEIAGWFADFISQSWQQLGQPCSRPALDRALDYSRARAAAYNPQTAVLVHGDAHNTNTLLDPAAGRPEQPTFKLIDPDGILAEPAYDLGVLMREWPDELASQPLELGQARCAHLSRLTGADQAAIWQWGYLQCLATGLLLRQVGQPRAGRRLLKIAEAWAAA